MSLINEVVYEDGKLILITVCPILNIYFLSYIIYHKISLAYKYNTNRILLKIKKRITSKKMKVSDPYGEEDWTDTW
jgi:hypothetical protein